MKIQVIKPFKWCVKGNIHPSDFIEGVYDVDSDVAEGAIGAGWAVFAKDAPTANEVELPQEIISESEGWQATLTENGAGVLIGSGAEIGTFEAGKEEGINENPFTEEAGGELSASQQEIASQEKIAEKPKKKYPRVGE
jgi:hypothetical protein